MEKNKKIMLESDVVSLYPSIAIKNHLYPEHLTEGFCEVYKSMLIERLKHKKGTPENALYKLALNGSYGKSNSIYSPLYDPQFTMSITINGQLSMLMLAEMFMEIESLELIQINTDGIVSIMDTEDHDEYLKKCSIWEKKTNLTLEHTYYRRFFQRDVNSYLAEKTDGSVKRKGAYEYDRQWHQNQSALVVPKCAEQVLLNRVNIREWLENHDDLFDFCLRTKVPKSSRLEGTDEFGDTYLLQNITRYFVSIDGMVLDKVMPPLAKNPGVERHISIEKGYSVTDVSVWREFDKSEINYDYYIEEVRKLTDPILSDECMEGIIE